MKKELGISVKEWVGWIVVFLCNGFLWWYFRSYLNFLLGVCMILGILLSAVLFFHEKDKLGIVATLPGSAVGRKISVPLTLRITNDGWLPFPVSLHYELENAFTNGRKEFHYMGSAHPGRKGLYPIPAVDDMLTMQHYGNLTVKVKEAKVYDFLHLFYWTGCSRQDAWMISAPGNTKRSEQVEKQIARLMPQNSLRRSVDYNTDYEIREYRPQDNMRDIHWKLTAKQKRLMVRERLTDGRPTANVVLILSDLAEENDMRIEVLDGLCRQLIKEKYPIRLYWSPDNFALNMADISSVEDLESGIYEILSGRGCGQTMDAIQLFEEEHPGEEAIHVGDISILEKTT